MSLRNQHEISAERKELDKCTDEVDPRVQIELERLNTATDDINKLEVDLDEARAGFRQLLCDSTVRIDVLAKKLGACVERARPYYEARMRAKEALQETQQAAVRFERANSAHAAAKEMVFLAEEGLSAEGRTFDHAWQEMLNHATMRVNESERERTLSELEHRRTSQCYHRAEVHVQKLQKELKRAIAKSSLNARRSLLQINSLAYQHQLQLLPYFEMKAQFNHLLEEQKKRVKCLEKLVADAKMSYAEALHNLEQISDEIHRTRKYDNGEDPLGVCNSLPPVQKEKDNKQSCRLLSSSPMPDDAWSDSQSMGLQDSDSGDEFMKLPPKLGPAASPIVCKIERNNLVSQVSEYLGLSELSKSTSDSETHSSMAELPVKSQNTLQLSTSSPKIVASSVSKYSDEKAVEHTKTDGSMQMNAKMPIKSLLSFSNTSSENDNTSGPESSQIASSPHNGNADQVWTEISLVESPDEISQPFAKMGPLLKNKVEGNYVCYTPLQNKTSSTYTEMSSSKNSNVSPSRSKPGGPKVKLDSSLSGWISGTADATGRRQSLDTLLWGGPTSERVKELLSHGMMMLNISSLTERRASEPKVSEDHNTVCSSVVKEIKGTEIAKKVPSPLEKSLNYLNAEDDSTSDSESLASVEMLTDEQISSLMLDQDIQDACEEVLGTPISEISPLIQDLKEKMQYNRSDFDDE